MKNSKEIDNQMSYIIDDINNLIYEDVELNETEVIINDKEIVYDTSKAQKRYTRQKAGKGIACLGHKFTGIEY